MNTYVLTFESTHAALAASKTLTSGGVDFWTIPTPREISAGCGIALRFSSEDPSPVVTLVFGENRDTERASLYLMEGEGDYRRLALGERGTDA